MGWGWGGGGRGGGEGPHPLTSAGARNGPSTEPEPSAAEHRQAARQLYPGRQEESSGSVPQVSPSWFVRTVSRRLLASLTALPVASTSVQCHREFMLGEGYG